MIRSCIPVHSTTNAPMGTSGPIVPTAPLANSAVSAKSVMHPPRKIAKVRAPRLRWGLGSISEHRPLQFETKHHGARQTTARLPVPPGNTRNVRLAMSVSCPRGDPMVCLVAARARPNSLPQRGPMVYPSRLAPGRNVFPKGDPYGTSVAACAGSKLLPKGDPSETSRRTCGRPTTSAPKGTGTNIAAAGATSNRDTNPGKGSTVGGNR